MFYCKKCQVKNEWPESIGRSYGKCECCDVIADCSNVPSSHLPKKKELDPFTGLETRRK